MARPGSRPSRSLKRKVGTRKPRKTFVIFCEGERTEPEYFDALRRQPAVRDVAAVDIRLETAFGGSAPQTLVSIAATARRRAIEERDEIDEFWCVFDVEWPKNHPHLTAALQLAHDNGIMVAVSNPCFELWLVLHHQDQTAWLSSKQACQLRRMLDGSQDKGMDATGYMSLIDVAAARAEHLDRRHVQNGTRFPRNNPSSGMHRFVTSIRP